MKSTNANKEKKIVTGAIIIGIVLYLSKFLRVSFIDNDSALFVLSFLPNFGLAFTLPFIYVSNRVRLNKPVKIPTACLVTILLMVLNEIRDKYQSGRVFDWNDIYASFAGVIFSFVVFHVALKKYREKIEG